MYTGFSAAMYTGVAIYTGFSAPRYTVFSAAIHTGFSAAMYTGFNARSKKKVWHTDFTGWALDRQPPTSLLGVLIARGGLFVFYISK